MEAIHDRLVRDVQGKDSVEAAVDAFGSMLTCLAETLQTPDDIVKIGADHAPTPPPPDGDAACATDCAVGAGVDAADDADAGAAAAAVAALATDADRPRGRVRDALQEGACTERAAPRAGDVPPAAGAERDAGTGAGTGTSALAAAASGGGLSNREDQHRADFGMLLLMSNVRDGAGSHAEAGTGGRSSDAAHARDGRDDVRPTLLGTTAECLLNSGQGEDERRVSAAAGAAVAAQVQLAKAYAAAVARPLALHAVAARAAVRSSLRGLRERLEAWRFLDTACHAYGVGNSRTDSPELDDTRLRAMRVPLQLFSFMLTERERAQPAVSQICLLAAKVLRMRDQGNAAGAHPPPAARKQATTRGVGADGAGAGAPTTARAPEPASARAPESAEARARSVASKRNAPGHSADGGGGEAATTDGGDEGRAQARDDAAVRFSINESEKVSSGASPDAGAVRRDGNVDAGGCTPPRSIECRRTRRRATDDDGPPDLQPCPVHAC